MGHRAMETNVYFNIHNMKKKKKISSSNLIRKPWRSVCVCERVYDARAQIGETRSSSSSR